MIYIFTALFPEARPLIDHLGLKRSGDFAHFQVWISESGDDLLAVTGVGPVSAAIVSSSVFTTFPPGPGDHILNIGICAGIGVDHTGDCFLASVITEADTGRSYYPDLLWKHSFPEAALCSGSRVLTDSDNPVSGSRVLTNPDNPVSGSRILTDSDDPVLTAYRRKVAPFLYDMEAAAIYQSGAVYAGPHQMSFLKIVSDHGNGRFPSPGEVTELVKKQLPEICQYIEDLPAPGPQLQDPPLLEPLAADLHCSVTMRHTLRQYLVWAKLGGSSLDEKIQEMYTDGILPSKDRKEGKKILEQLRSYLL